VLPAAHAWVSDRDIGAGARWSDELVGVLAETKVGVICLTRDSQQKPWLLFEAGALAKQKDKVIVCPYLLDLEEGDVAPGPLTMFQSKRATEEGTRDLFVTINKALQEPRKPESFGRVFDSAWPKLEAKLNVLPRPPAPSPRSQDDVLKEILATVRSLARRSAGDSDVPPLWPVHIWKGTVSETAKERLRETVNAELERIMEVVGHDAYKEALREYRKMAQHPPESPRYYTGVLDFMRARFPEAER